MSEFKFSQRSENNLKGVNADLESRPPRPSTFCR
jgi:hypothetical protein